MAVIRANVSRRFFSQLVHLFAGKASLTLLKELPLGQYTMEIYRDKIKDYLVAFKANPLIWISAEGEFPGASLKVSFGLSEPAPGLSWLRVSWAETWRKTVPRPMARWRLPRTVLFAVAFSVGFSLQISFFCTRYPWGKQRIVKITKSGNFAL